MTKTFAATAIILYCLFFTGMWLYAADKTPPKPCEVQLAEHQIRVFNMATDRSAQLATKEEKIAELQAALYFVTQQKQALEKQVELLKPKPEDKKE